MVTLEAMMNRAADRDRHADVPGQPETVKQGQLAGLQLVRGDRQVESQNCRPDDEQGEPEHVVGIPRFGPSCEAPSRRQTSANLHKTIIIHLASGSKTETVPA
jgi:hypothetical protein